MGTKSLPLVHELGSASSAPNSSPKTVISIHREGETAQPHSLRVNFKRTIRVSDNNTTNALPPSLGDFPLYNVADYKSTLPSAMTAKGGYFLPMHRK